MQRIADRFKGLLEGMIDFLMEAPERIYDFMKASVGAVVAITEDWVIRYWNGLKSLAWWSFVIAGFSTLLFLLSLLTGLQAPWIYSGYFIVLALLAGLLLLASLPILVIADYISDNVEKIKVNVRRIAGVVFWILLLALYFHSVPVWKNPRQVPLVLLLIIILTLGWYRFGIGINPKLIIIKIYLLFSIVTLGFIFPQSISTIFNLIDDKKLAELIEGKPSQITLNIDSLPSGADVYLNWKQQGQTPISIKSQSIKGILVIMKTGFMTDYREVDFQKDETVTVNFLPEGPIGSNKFLLIMKEDLPAEEGFNNLRRALLKQGLTTTGIEEEKEFKKQMQLAGDISNKGLLAWARSKFGVDSLIFSKLVYHSAELSQVDIGHPRIQTSLKGMYKIEVKLDVEVLDLKTGDTTFSFSTEAEDTSVDKLKSLQEVIRKVSSESAQKIRQEAL